MIHILVLIAVGVYELMRQICFAFMKRASIWVSKSKSRSELESESTQACLDSLERVHPVVVISGASSGIGKEIYCLIRTRAQRVIVLASAEEATPVHANDYDDDDIVLPIDFGDRESTVRAAVRLKSLLRRDASSNNRVLFIHCAGVYYPLPRDTAGLDRNGKCREGGGGWKESVTASAQKTLSVNATMPALLLHELGHAVDGVVVLGSVSQQFALHMRPGRCPAARSATPAGAYATSKALLLICVGYWGRRTDVPVLVVHPGVVASALFRSEPGFRGVLTRAWARALGWSPAYSARRVLGTIEGARLLDAIQTSTQTSSQTRPPLFWDAVTARPVPLPARLRDPHATAIAEWFYSQLIRSKS